MVGSDEDFGLPPAEVSRTLERLFAIPTQAYTNAFGDAGADMRPAMPTFTFGPEDGGIMKLGMPSFALSQTTGSRSVGKAHAAPTTALAQRGTGMSDTGHDKVMSDLLGHGPRSSGLSAGVGSGLQQEVDESHKWSMGSQWLSLAQKSTAASALPVHHAHSLVTKAAVPVQKAIPAASKVAAKAIASKQHNIAAAAVAQKAQLHAVTTALSGAALSASSLASVESQRVKALAHARLAKKHDVLASMKREHTDATDDGPSEHGRKKANLDSQISGSGKWLQKAVMVLAIIAGTCICGGICGECPVTVCP